MAKERPRTELPPIVEFLFTTGLGQLVLLAVVLGLVALFVPWTRYVLGPLWRLATGGLVLERPGPWDSTWLYAAPHRPQDRPNFRGERFPRTRWGRMPGYQRMTIRWAAVGYLWALATYPAAVAWTTATLVVFLVVRRIVRTVRDWGLRRATGVFTAGAAALLGYGDRDPATWIAVPRMRLTWLPVPVDPRILRTARRLPGVGDRLEHILGALAVPTLRVPLDADNASVRIALDAEITNKNLITDVAELAMARLPDGPWQARHRHKELTVELTHPKRPPSQVWYDAAAHEAFPVDEVPIGQRAGNEWATLPLKRLTPHVIVSASTGWGKTTIANVYVAHTAGKGGRVLLNDPKRIGYLRAFGDLPNVSIASTIEGWVAHVDAFHAEMQRRYEIIERFPETADDPERYFQPWFLVTDERGSYVSEIRAWWKAEGEKGTTAPPLRKEKINLWQARAAAMYMLDAAQQANLDVFLDSDGRDQRMARIAAGPQTRSSWMMLFPGTAKIKALMKKGRAMLGIGPDDVEEVQLAQVSIDDARAFAAAGAAIAELENAEREMRLADLIGGSVPAAGSPGSPGETPAGVPGQRRPDGLPEFDVEMVPGAFPATPPPGFEESPGESVRPIPSVTREGAENRPRNADGQPMIVGLDAAAEFLGMNRDSFEKARQRRPIRGEVRHGQRPAWAALNLQEWRAQAPRAGRPAAGDQ